MSMSRLQLLRLMVELVKDHKDHKEHGVVSSVDMQNLVREYLNYKVSELYKTVRMDDSTYDGSKPTEVAMQLALSGSIYFCTVHDHKTGGVVCGLSLNETNPYKSYTEYTQPIQVEIAYGELFGEPWSTGKIQDAQAELAVNPTGYIIRKESLIDG